MNKNYTGVHGSMWSSGLMIALLFALLFVSHASAQSTYEIFTTQDDSLADADVTVYHVKKGDNLLAVINQSLKTDGVMDEDTAATYVTQRLQDTLISQMTGLTKAAQYRLKYFPAIVKDNKFVLYGTTNPKAFNGINH